MTTVLIILLIFILLGAIPVWPHSQPWGWWPGSVVGVVLVILLVLALLGRI